MPMGLAGAAGAAGKGTLTPAIRHSKLGRPSGGGGKSPKKKKTSRAIIAVILVLGLIAGGYTAVLQGLFGILDDDDQNGGYYETRLYVRATDAGNPEVIPLSKVPDDGDINGTAEENSSNGSASSVNPTAALMTIPGLITAHAASSDDTGTDSSAGTDAKAPNGQGDDPTAGAISDLLVALTAVDQDKDKKKDDDSSANQSTDKSSTDDKDKKQDDSTGGDLNIGPTNNYGIAYTILTGAANGAFTYACPAEYQPDSSGRPTNYVTKLTGQGTMYDSYTVRSYKDTTGWYGLDVDPSGNSSSAGFATGGWLSGVRGSPSDTWHVAGKPMSRNVGLSYWDYIYVYNTDHPEASYGTAVVGDCGGMPNSAIVDQYMPASKYFGYNGLNVARGSGFAEGAHDPKHIYSGPKSSFGHYFQAFGLDPNFAATANVEVYILAKGNGTQSHPGNCPGGNVLSQQCFAGGNSRNKQPGNNWPGVSGNPVANLSGSSSTETMPAPDSSTGGNGSAQYEITYSGTEESAEKGKDLITPYGAGSRDAPFTTYIKSKKGTNVRLEFWVERIYIGPGENASVNSGDYSDWANTHFPTYYSHPPQGKNVYTVSVNPGRIDNSDRNALPNCVAYAWGLEARKGHVLPHWGDADQWASKAIKAGYSVDRRANPRVGDVFCLAPTCHVGVVIGVDQKNGKVITAESDYRNKISKNENLCVPSTRTISSIPYFIHMK